MLLYGFGRRVFPVDVNIGRVFRRMGLLNPLGIRLPEHVDRHRERQTALAQLVPPALRYSLHVNMVAHGKQICQARRPRCEICPVSQFCAYFHHSVLDHDQTSS